MFNNAIPMSNPVSAGNPGTSAGNGNSSLDDLSSAMVYLVGYASHFDGTSGDAVPTKLGMAGGNAIKISETFKGANNSIANSWEQTHDLLLSVSEKVATLMREFDKQLTNFIDISKGHEGEIQSAVDQANDAANDVINELGL